MLSLFALLKNFDLYPKIVIKYSHNSKFPNLKSIKLYLSIDQAFLV
jgi:hypothetical protein